VIQWDFMVILWELMECYKVINGDLINGNSWWFYGKLNVKSADISRNYPAVIKLSKLQNPPFSSRMFHSNLYLRGSF